MTMMKFGAVLLALMLVPALALAVVLEGTIVKVDKAKQLMVVQTEEGQKTLQVTSNTKGLENAQEGAKVTINYRQTGNQLVAGEISASEASPKSAPGSKSIRPGGADDAPRGP